SFSTELSGLSTLTTYFLRAFATNSAGTSYGSQVSFTTLNPFVNKPPTLNPIQNVEFLHTIPAAFTIPLSGISAGADETGQSITISAQSSNPQLIPLLEGDYTSPQSIGILRIQNNRSNVGSAVIYLRVKDDAGIDNGGIDSLLIS